MAKGESQARTEVESKVEGQAPRARAERPGRRAEMRMGQGRGQSVLKTRPKARSEREAKVEGCGRRPLLRLEGKGRIQTG